MTEPAPIDAIDVIRAKRDGGALTAEQIRWVIDAYTARRVPDEQMSALLMAVFFRGMDAGELAAWTAGDDRLRRAHGPLRRWAGRPPTSTRPAGWATRSRCRWRRWWPPAASPCPQLSGRGLGPHRRHAGQARVDPRLAGRPAPGRPTSRSCARSARSICAAGDDLAPADKKLYALRDVTGTVESIPLIASSIMSKKIAEGADALVLDVKTGSGAFMRDPDDARELARTMVGLGRRPACAPWRWSPRWTARSGRAAGNAVEVAESVEVLAGGGPADVVELTLALAREMLAGAGRADVDPADALRRRPRHGRLAADDRRAGRRPRRAAAAAGRDPRGDRARRPAR